MWISVGYTWLISLRNGVRIRSVIPQITVSSMTYAGNVRSTPCTTSVKSRRTPRCDRRASGSQNTRAASTPGTRVGRYASANTKGRTTTAGGGGGWGGRGWEGRGGGGGRGEELGGGGAF